MNYVEIITDSDALLKYKKKIISKKTFFLFYSLVISLSLQITIRFVYVSIPSNGLYFLGNILFSISLILFVLYLILYFNVCRLRLNKKYHDDYKIIIDNENIIFHNLKLDTKEYYSSMLIKIEEYDEFYYVTSSKIVIPKMNMDKELKLFLIANEIKVITPIN